MNTGYGIEPVQLATFLTSQYKLPRFQRKETWKPKQCFELCISIFQGYPLGVCIVNKTNEGSFLLDGRQRLKCCTTLFEDPITVHAWAQSYCKFKARATAPEVEEEFKNRVLAYLGTNLDDITEQSNEDEVISESGEEVLDETEARYFDYEAVKRLLDYVLMVHPVEDWKKAFDYSKWFTPKSIKYFVPKESDPSKRELDPKKVCAFIRESSKFISTTRNKELLFDKSAFIQYIENNWTLIGEGSDSQLEAKNKARFESHVGSYWETIEKTYSSIAVLDKVLEEARVGQILLTNANTLDAQNIFKRINSGGSQLTAAELLSARPYWNKYVHQQSSDEKIIEKLYSKLKIPFINSVRWDIPATMVSRIDPSGYFFKSNNADDSVVDPDISEISCGFKILSACYVFGISKISLDEFEKEEEDLWEDNLSGFIQNMKSMIKAIGSQTGLQTLLRWKRSVSDILGTTPTIELLAISYFEWMELQTHMAGTNETKKFFAGVKNHLDRLVFEKVTRQWKGSSDSKLATNIASRKTRIGKLSDSENERWNQMIAAAICGSIDGTLTKQDEMETLLYYAKIVTASTPWAGDNSFDTDHIYPKSLFDTNEGINQEYKESLTNLAILDSSTNRSKKEKKLNSLDQSQKVKVSSYEEIEVGDFDKYSDITNFKDLIDTRGAKFQEYFNSNRLSYLLNN